MWLFYKTGFQKQLVSYRAGSFTSGYVPLRHIPICFCVRFADRSYLYVTGFLSETSCIPLIIITVVNTLYKDLAAYAVCR